MRTYYLSAADDEAVRIFNERLTRGEEEFIPGEFVDRMIDGECKIIVWREYRGLSAHDLAENTGISADELSKIASGELEAADSAIAKIAAVLKLSIDDLV